MASGGDGYLPGRKLPDEVQEMPHGIAGGILGRSFALVHERSWTWPDRSCLRRFVLVWGNVETRELRGCEVAIGEHCLAVLDAEPERVVVGTYRDEPLSGIDPRTGQLVWRNDELRRAERMRALAGSRRIAVRFREKGTRLVGADDGTWADGAANADIAGDEEHRVILHDRQAPVLVVRGRSVATMARVVESATDAAVGHGLVVVVGAGVHAFRLDGSAAWSHPAMHVSRVRVTAAGFRAVVHRSGRTPLAVELSPAGTVLREVEMPYGFHADMVGADLYVTSSAVVADARDGRVVWKFEEELDRVVTEVCSSPPLAERAPAKPTSVGDPKPQAVPIRRRVHHPTYGLGTVERRLDAGKVAVRFDDGIERVLLARFVRDAE